MMQDKKRARGFQALAAAALCLCYSLTVHSDPLPAARPASVGVDEEPLVRAFEEVNVAVLEGAAPGAVGLVLKNGKVIARQAVGNRQTHTASFKPQSWEVEYTPALIPMTEDTIFDIASLTKMVVTTTSVMMLAEQGKLDLDRPVAKYLPTFAALGKETITPRQLLTHTSGLPAWSPFFEIIVHAEELYRILDEEVAPENLPGAKRIYSDLGFLTLGRLVEKISGLRLDRFADKNIFAPLGLYDTDFLPRMDKRTRIAPTEFDPFRRHILQGIVDDENARSLGGIAGHAGLFSTVDDLAVFAQMLLGRGQYGGKRILRAKTVEQMLTPQVKPEVLQQGSGFLQSREQLLGWWGMDEKITIDTNGGLPSKSAFGHSGFTGCMIYIDPEHDAAAIFLSNAIHPRREDAAKKPLYQAFFSKVSEALAVQKPVAQAAAPKRDTPPAVKEAPVKAAPAAKPVHRRGRR